MFASACAKAREFTRPVVISQYLRNGAYLTSVGSFVVVNREGWILSAWHIQQGMEALVQAVHAAEVYDVAVSAIQSDGPLTPKEQRRQLRKLQAPAPDACRKWSPWWSWDGVQLVEAYGFQLPSADILVGRLEPFDPNWIGLYPEIKDPAKPLPQGTSLCRMGFPFPNIQATYDPPSNRFTFDHSKGQLAIFPIEGILTRYIEAERLPSGLLLGFLETSSPGLMGQSGGPIMDVHGAVWAIQSTTRHLSLGFDPPVPGGKPGEKEHQFLNVGWGTHPESIVGLLREKGVAHTLTAY
jgi:hypothetical protein